VTEILIKVGATGIIATLVMDIVSLMLNRAGVFDLPDYGLLGRWVGSMLATGTFAHKSIGRAAPVPFEKAIGWLVHYATGIAFTSMLFAFIGMQWLQTPTLAPALLMGLATIAFPLFVMQPAFGLGVAARLSPNPRKALLRSLLNHLSFGLGLYLGAVASAAL
jgi:hypothetical protein